MEWGATAPFRRVPRVRRTHLTPTKLLASSGVRKGAFDWREVALVACEQRVKVLHGNGALDRLGGYRTYFRPAAGRSRTHYNPRFASVWRMERHLGCVNLGCVGALPSRLVLVLGALSVDFGCHFEPPFANPQVDGSRISTPGEKSPKKR